eukprot:COSAG05_NODE_418_length_10011_cov_18.784100_5_plen_1012_part_00
MQEHKDTDWGGADSIVIVAGKGGEEQTVYWVSVAVQLYLLDVELPESIILMTKGTLHFLGSSSKVKKLRVLEDYDGKPAELAVKLIVKDKDDHSAQLSQLLDLARGAGPKVGTILKEAAFGTFAADWQKLVDLESVDVCAGVLEAIASKDDVELKNLKVAAVMTCAILRKHLIPQLEGIVDDETDIAQTKIAEDLEELFDDPTKLASAWKAATKIDRDRVDMTYPPIIQSGGTYNLKPSAATTGDKLHYGTDSSPGVILVSMGARYKSYCSNLTRTFMVNPTEPQRNTYSTLVKLREHLVKLFVPGTRIGDVMTQAKDFVAKQAPDLLPNLTKNCGSGMGIAFRERSFLINAKNDRKMRKGMTFNLSIGFDNLNSTATSDEKSKIYAVQLSDTIVVGDTPDILTKPASVEENDVLWETRDDDADGDANGDAEEEELERGAAALLNQVGTDKRDAVVESAGQERKLRQDEIAKAQREEALRRFKKMDEEQAKQQSKVKIPVSYESAARYPKLKRPAQINVDSSSDSVFLPVFGTPVPIHVAFIKNISRQSDANGQFVELRINMVTPGLTAASAGNLSFKDPKATFVKELMFRSSNTTRVNAQFQMINATKKEWLRRQKEKADKDSLVHMESLKMFRGGPPPRLPDCSVRPALPGRGRRTGTLEIHANGLRYKSAQNAPLDITYQNVKHAFFQQAVNDMKSEFRDDHVRIHFHLRDEIMVGKKKTKDIQFVTQVGEDNIKLSDVRRSAYDPDELEDEQRERERRSKINKVYRKFVARIQEESQKTSHAMEFDIPYRELCFTGRATLKGSNKGESFFMPTKDCLVDLCEPPFFLIDINELEIVYFERVSHNLKYFDLVFVCKDYETWVRIDSIPTKKLENVKTWVDSINVRYYEGASALKWKDVLNVARTDPEAFWDEGGWDAIFGPNEDSDEDDESSDEGDGEFSAEEEEEESSEDYDSEDEGSEEDEFAGEDELSESGEDWDEAEKRALKDDRSRKRDDEIDEGRSKKRSRR